MGRVSRGAQVVVVASLGLMLYSCGLEVVGTATTPGDAGAESTTDAHLPPLGDASSDVANDASGGDGGAPCAPGTSFTSDPRNCGSCGHDCLGGACSSGTCTPFALVTFAGGGGDAPHGIFVDGASLYVALRGSGKVVTCTRTGATCSVPATLRSSLNQPSGVAVAPVGGRLIWSEAGGNSVQTCVLPACASTLPWVNNNPSPDFVAVHGGLLYWAVSGAGPIGHCTVTNNCMDQTPYVGGQGTPSGVAVDDSNVYWSNKSGGALRRCATNGIGMCTATPTSLATGLNAPAGVAVDATRIYFTEPAAGAVRSCPLPAGCSGALTDVATGQAAPSGVAVDATMIYWTNEGDGRVMALVR